MAVGNQSSHQVNQEIGGAVMAGMLNLANVLELIGDGHDEGALTQQELVGQTEQAIAHRLKHT